MNLLNKLVFEQRQKGAALRQYIPDNRAPGHGFWGKFWVRRHSARWYVSIDRADRGLTSSRLVNGVGNSVNPMLRLAFENGSHLGIGFLNAER